MRILLLLCIILPSFMFGLVDFTESMGRKNKQLQLFEWLYNENNFEKVTFSKEATIPKKIHQIWIGSPVPEKFKRFMASWQKKHPDWQYYLWTDDDAKEFSFQNRKQFESAKNMGMKADIWRYEILAVHGGLYVDVDFECLKAMDIFHHTCELYAGLHGDGAVGNSLIGAKANHPVLQRAIQEIGELEECDIPNDAIQEVTGPAFLTRLIAKQAVKNYKGLAIYPSTFFFPLPNSERKGNESSAKWIKPESFAVHYWACSWTL